MSPARLLFSVTSTFMLLLCLCTPVTGSAQTCTPIYKKTYGGSGVDEGLDIIHTTDKGSIVAGRTSSDAANTNGFLMKLDQQGALQWVKSYGGDQYDELVKVKQTSDGGYVAIGNTKFFGQTSGEAFLLRTDANGRILWSRRLSKNGVPANAKNLIQLSDGGFAVGLNLNDSTAQGDGLVLRTDAVGAVIWAKHFDQGGSGGIHTLLENGDALVVSGYTTVDYLDGVLMKLRLSDGAQIWAKRFVRGNGLNEECLNVEKIPGGYAFGVLSRLPESIFNSNEALLTLFKMKEDGTIYYQRKVDVWTGMGYNIESVDLRYTADSGFLFLANDTAASKNGCYKKVNASGLTEWGRGPSKYYEVNSINGMDMFADRGYLFTGTYKGFSFGNDAASSDVQVLKTDAFGSFGSCTGDQYGAFEDTVQFLYIGPFTWNSIRDESVSSSVVSLTSLTLPFTENLACEALDCEPVSTSSADNCYASFVAYYSEKYKFVPFDVLKTVDGYIMSGYVQHYWGVEPQVVKLRLNGTVAWAKTLNNYIHGASFQKVYPTGDGNILLTGPDDHVINHGGYTSTTFIKITPDGQVLWAKSVEGSMPDLKPVGNGRFAGIMLYGITSPPTTVAKFTLDAAGNFSSLKRLNGPLEYVASYTKIVFDGKNMYAAGDLFGYMVIDKLDSSGKRIWTKQFKNNNNTLQVQSLHLIGDSVYVTATLISPLGWASKGNLALIKISKEGGGLKGLVLNKPDLVPDFNTYYFWPQTWITRVTITEDNNFALVDRVADGADSVIAITKFSPAGAVLWSKKFPGLTQRKVMAVHDDEGSLLIAGYRIKDGDPYYGTSTIPMLIRTNSLGEIISGANSACSAVPNGATFVPLKLELGFPYEAPTPTYEYADYYVVPFTPLERAYNVGSDLGCRIPGNCSSLKISGLGSICNQQETVVYKTIRNSGCLLPATWVCDTAMIRMIASTDTTLSVQFKGAGSAKIYAKYSTGCGTLTDTMTVAVLPAANMLSLGSDTTLCPGNTILLYAGKGFASYKWQNGSTDSLFTVTEPGLYHVSVTDLCGRSHADSIKVNARPLVPFVISRERIKCNNDTLRFTAPSGFINYSWSSSDNNNPIGGRDVVVNPSINTVYYVKAEKTPGCFAYDTIQVTVNRSPLIQLGPDRSFCSGAAATFDAGAGFSSYEWNTGDFGQQITVISAGQFTVKATTAQGCSSYDTVSVLNVWEPLQAKLDKSTSLCSGETRVLDPGDFSSYRWQDGSTTATYNITKPGSYFVQVTDIHNCLAYDTVTIRGILPVPQNFLPPDTAICSYSAVSLSPLQSYRSYLWSQGSRTKSLSIAQPGIYWLQVEDTNGCVGNDSIIVKLKDCMAGVYVPTAFSPNNDSKNDVFVPEVFGPVSKFEFRIYDRWGHVVFTTIDGKKGWDGKVNGLEQATGAFVWTCQYQLPGEPVKITKGTVVLIR